MSDGAVHRELLAFLLTHNVARVAERDILSVLAAARTGPLGLLYAAAVDAGCEAAIARARAAGCFACFAAGNLADDLADGDCTYLARATATGPALEFMLLHAAYGLWLGPGQVGTDAVRHASRWLTGGSTYQLAELSAETFTLPIVREIAAGMGGAQYAAYLAVSWDRTPFATSADDVGTSLGNAGFVAEDRRSVDPRFTTLGVSDRAELLGWARLELVRAASCPLPSVQAAVRYIGPLLDGNP